MSYTLIEQVNPQHAHLTFRGQFQGKAVTWDTHFYTVVEYNQQHNATADSARQFIDIEGYDDATMNLTVALNVAEIDPPAVQKMMIMIRQYKNLSTGRHEYGDEILLKQTRKK